MISLHSCGDLTPHMLNIFSQNKNYLKFLVTFGCCYHKMEENGNCSNFKHFPLSEALNNIFKSKFPNLKLTKYALRVGGQENL